MTEFILIILAVAVLLVGIVIIFLLLQKSARDAERDASHRALLEALNQKDSSPALKLAFDQMNSQISGLAQLVDKKLDDSRRVMDQSKDAMTTSVREQFGESQKLIKDITERVTQQLLNVTKGVTESNEAAKQVFTVAESLRNLEKVLKNQKQRGTLGEAGLELILSNVLPPTAYKLQYLFPGGDKVDAVILTKEGIIPVDAKFSLDNYTRLSDETDEVKKAELEKEFKNDLKKRIDETAKYIRPEEGTLPFAFMFIPAEGIYYDLMVNEVGSVKANTRSLIDYAYNDRKVIIVSPTTFSAYLQSVLYGFKAFKIEESAKDIIKRVGELGKHLGAYEQFMTSLGNSLGTTVNHYNRAHKELAKIDKDVIRIAGDVAGAGIEALSLDKPLKEEE